MNTCCSRPQKSLRRLDLIIFDRYCKSMRILLPRAPRFRTCQTPKKLTKRSMREVRACQTKVTLVYWSVRPFQNAAFRSARSLNAIRKYSSLGLCTKHSWTNGQAIAHQLVLEGGSMPIMTCRACRVSWIQMIQCTLSEVICRSLVGSTRQSSKTFPLGAPKCPTISFMD